MPSHKQPTGKKRQATRNYNSTLSLDEARVQQVDPFVIKRMVMSDDSPFENEAELRPLVDFANKLPEPEGAFLLLSRCHIKRLNDSTDPNNLPTAESTIERIKERLKGLYANEVARRKGIKAKRKAEAKKGKCAKNGSKAKKKSKVEKTESKPNITTLLGKAVDDVTGDGETEIIAADRKVGFTTKKPKVEHLIVSDSHSPSHDIVHDEPTEADLAAIEVGEHHDE